MNLQEIKTLLEQSNSQLETRFNNIDTRVNDINQTLIEVQKKWNLDRVYAAGADDHPTSVRLTLPSLKEFRANEQRGMRIAEDQHGGYLVTDDAAGPFFTALGARAVMLAAGPLVVNMESDRKPLPQEVSDDTEPDPVGESAEIDEQDMLLGKTYLAARKYPIRTRVSSELLDDSNPSARELIASWQIRKLARRLDKDFLGGNGGPTSIIGMRRWPGVSVTPLDTNGRVITLDDIQAALGRLDQADVDLANVAIFMNGRTWQTLSGEKDTTDRYQLQPDPTTQARKVLFGRPVFTSSQISIAETVGSSNDCSWVGFADMTRIAIGRRKQYTVLYDPFSRSKWDEIVVQTITRMAFAVVDAAAVDIISGVRA